MRADARLRGRRAGRRRRMLASYVGIEINPQRGATRAARIRARTRARVQIVHGDIRDVDYGTADAVVILDVLHYNDYASQERCCARVRAALAAGRAAAAADRRRRRGRAASAWARRSTGRWRCARRGRWVRLQCRRADRVAGAAQRAAAFATRAVPMSARHPLRERPAVAPRSHEAASRSAPSPPPAASAAALAALSPTLAAAAQRPRALRLRDRDARHLVGEVPRRRRRARCRRRLAEFECRNNRLALARPAPGRLRRSRRARPPPLRRARASDVFLGTSTSGILETEIAYRQRDPSGALPADVPLSRRPQHLLAGGVRAAGARLAGPAAVISSACSSSAKVFASARRAIEARPHRCRGGRAASTRCV